MGRSQLPGPHYFFPAIDGTHPASSTDRHTVPDFAFLLTLQQTDRRFSGSSGYSTEPARFHTYAETIGRWDSTSTRQTTRLRNWSRSFQTKRKTGAVHPVNDAGIVFYLPLIQCVSSR